MDEAVVPAPEPVDPVWRRGALGPGFTAVLDVPTATLALVGEVDSDRAADLDEVLRGHTQDFTAPLSVDLSGLTYLPSAALAALVTASRRARSAGTTLDLLARPGTIAQRVLLATGIPHRVA